MLVLLVFLLDKLRHTPCPPAKKFEKLDEGGNQFSWCLFVFGARGAGVHSAGRRKPTRCPPEYIFLRMFACIAFWKEC